MSDLLKMCIASGLGFALGLLIEKWREQKREYQNVLDAYLTSVSNESVDCDEYLRFAALQRAGAWRLSLRDIKRLAEDVVGRGHPSPFDAWVDVFPEQKDFPKGFLMWAKKKRVNFSDPDAVMLAVAEEWDARDIPKPAGPGIYIG